MRKGTPVLPAMLLLVGLTSLAAQELTFKATVDRNRIALGDVVTLTLTVSANTARLPKPEIPEIKDFDMLSRGSARNFSIVNGKIQTSVSYTYLLAPKRKGTFTIGPYEIVMKGRTYRTAPIEITVDEPGAPPSENIMESPDRDAAGAIFIETFVDKEKVFVGEQIILTFRLYSAVRIVGNPQYFPPVTDGFWREDLGEEVQRTVVIKGTEYHVNELTYAIFPLTDGKMVIGAARLNAVIEEPLADPFDFSISTGTRKQLTSQPIALQVRPLPAMPAGFCGGVGNFTIDTRMDSDSVRQNEPLTVITTVSGDGNIREVVLPEMAIPGFRVYRSGSQVSIDGSRGKLSGKKTFKTILIPTKGGDYEIPPQVVLYFDPETGAYVTKRTEPLSFTVTPGEEGEMSEKVFSPFAVEKIGEDIHFIKTGPFHDQGGLGPIWYLWGLSGLLLTVFLWMAVSLELKERAKANEDVIRRRGALRGALRTIEKAAKQARGGDVIEAYELLHRAILQFFADKCNTSIWGMTEDEIIDRLRSRGRDEKRIAEIEAVLHACNRARYSTAKTDPKALLKQLRATQRILRSIRTL